MSLRCFLNVAFAILVEEYQRMGVDLISALEKVSEWGEGAKPEKAVVLDAAVVSQNKESMKQLRAMMGGIQ